MMKVVLFLVILGSYVTGVNEKYLTKNGIARFYSKTDLEDIRAENKQVLAIIDPATNSVAVSMLMKGFLFPKALMQTHFNENYVESDRYPKATFEGTYADPVDVSRNGTYNVNVKGRLSLHGVTREISVPASIVVTDGVLSGKTTFQLVPEDFKIAIPSLVRDKIARKVDVEILFECKKQ
jgi:polyisoprenoid-binding protein YceI